MRTILGSAPGALPAWREIALRQSGREAAIYLFAAASRFSGKWIPLSGPMLYAAPVRASKQGRSMTHSMSGTANLDAADVAAVLERVHACRPRVHCLTNTVVQNITANMLLAFGAIPSMATHVDEVAAVAEGAGALLINLGTINAEGELAIPKLVEVARDAGKPVVLDPVFVELSPLRRHLAREVLRLPNVVVRGNATEMKALAAELDAKPDAVRVTTGRVDRIEGMGRSFAVAQGHPLMTKLTGAGCVAGALIAACCAIEPDPLVAATAALTAYGIAGEIAAEKAQGPGSFAVHLIDAIAGIDAATLRRHMGDE